MEVRLKDLLREGFKIHTKGFFNHRDGSQTLNVSTLLGVLVGLCIETQLVDNFHRINRLIVEPCKDHCQELALKWIFQMLMTRMNIPQGISSCMA